MIGRIITAVLAMLLTVASVAMAQTPEALVSRDIAVFASGVNPATGTPVAGTFANTLKAQWTCGLTPKAVPPAAVDNPQEVYIDDPTNPALDCKLSAAATTALFGPVPIGTGFRVAARSHGATTVALWSVSSNPFNRVAVAPAVATGVRVQ